MKVKVLFFATLRDIIGTKSLDVEIPAPATVAELKSQLMNAYPGLSRVRDAMKVAVNHEYAADETIIPDGAEIAIFPPVSGG